MNANQYAVDLGFITVIRSISRSFGIQIESPTESTTPPRPSTCLIYPSDIVIQMRPPAFLLHQIGSHILLLLLHILRPSLPKNGLC